VSDAVDPASVSDPATTDVTDGQSAIEEVDQSKATKYSVNADGTAPELGVTPLKSQLKRKRQSDDTDAELQKSFAAMSSYFSARSATTSKKNEDEDDDTVFGKMVAVELKKISNGGIKRKVKKAITDSLFDGQSAVEELEKQPNLEQSNVTKYYAVNADGTLTEINQIVQPEC